MLNHEIITEHHYRLYYNKTHIGELYMEEDGYFYYSDNCGGNYDSYALRLISDYLDQLNKDWDNKVKKGLR